MSKILALDVGEKRIGLAVSDDLEILATPYKTIDRDGAIVVLKEIIEKEKAKVLVVGLPYLESGKLGSQADDIKKFTKELISNIDLPYEYVNEALSSKEAKDRLRTYKKRTCNKEEIDQIAATIILEDYLRSKN